MFKKDIVAIVSLAYAGGALGYVISSTLMSAVIGTIAGLIMEMALIKLEKWEKKSLNK